MRLFCTCVCVRIQFILFMLLFGQLVSVAFYYGLNVDQPWKGTKSSSSRLPGVDRRGHLRLLSSHLSPLLFCIVALVINTPHELGSLNRPSEVSYYLWYDHCRSLFLFWLAFFICYDSWIDIEEAGHRMCYLFKF